MTDQVLLAPDPKLDADWWRQACVYQIYPRSFADSNGDGIGDLAGVTSRIGYLAELGVDAIWLSPFYPSALADGGYDVSDYRNVAPELGTLADFDALVAAAHAVSIKVIVDIVPNHTSDQHPWFVEALASPPGSAARARYIFRDGTGPDGSLPPSDWISHFGGPAWTRVRDGQWYCHLFARGAARPQLGQPRGPGRLQDHAAVLGRPRVDGYRVDVAHALAKDLSEPLRSKPGLEDQTLPLDGSDPLYDRNEVHEIYAEWREVFNEYDPPRTAVAEAFARSERRPLYARPTGLGQAFNFDLLKAHFSAVEFASAITFCLDAGGQGRLVVDLGAVQPRLRPAHLALRPAGRGRLRRVADERRHTAVVRRDRRAAAGSGGHAADAGAARLVLPLPGRGARSARGLRPADPCPAGPHLAPDAEHQEGPGRLPGAAAVDRRRRLVRVRHRALLAAAAGGLLAHCGHRAVWPTRVDPGVLPGGAAGAPCSCRRPSSWTGSRPTRRRCCTSSGRGAGTV